jgi:S-formylglutathione hydrolase FrmB
VLELLHGTPGAPSDWFVKGSLRATADAFARAHGGMAPLVVVPDINGAQHADSECIRTATGGNVETFLTRDVVSWVRTHYAKAVGTARWWVAGLSEGGLCSAMLALRHPDLYAAFGDLSGLLAPRVEHVTAAQSDLQLYGGNATARREHQPLWLLQHRRYADLRGWFTSGASDTRVLAAQRALLAAARAAGLPTHAQLLPGRHTWTVWSTGLRDLLPWLWAARPR